MGTDKLEVNTGRRVHRECSMRLRGPLRSIIGKGRKATVRLSPTTVGLADCLAVSASGHTVSYMLSLPLEPSARHSLVRHRSVIPPVCTLMPPPHAGEARQRA